MSASLAVDLGFTCDYRPSVSLAVPVSPASGTVVGQIVDLQNADTFCNIFCAGGPASGVIEVRVQTSDGTTSGSFTDPTSGLPRTALPSFIASGGVMFVNSGLHSSGNSSLSSPVDNAPLFCSGGTQYGAFQRPHRYARLLVMSGAFPESVQAGFISNKRTVGSGGGFTYSPGSGTVNV